MGVTKHSYFVATVDDDYWRATYNSETNRVELKYDAGKALNHPLYSLATSRIEFKGNELDRVIKLLQALKEQSND